MMRSEIQSGSSLYGPRRLGTIITVLVVGFLVLANSVRAHATRSPTVWIPPDLFSGRTESELSDPNLIKPRKFEIALAPSRFLSFERMAWKGWGTARAVGTGRIQDCTKLGCTALKGAKVVLTEFFPDPCRGDVTSFYRYFTLGGEFVRVENLC
jgi:hypothetical protein